jgi:hypothetical protein
MYIVNLTFWALLFHFLNGIFRTADSFNFNEIQFTVFFYGLYFCDPSKRLLPKQLQNIKVCFLLKFSVHFFWSSGTKFFEKKLFSPHWITFVRNQMTVHVWMYFWALLFHPIDLSILSPTSYDLDYIAW